MKNNLTGINPGKILIRSTNWIGDAIMTTPAVRSVRENFPGTEISILALPWVADVFKDSPHVDKVFIYDKHGKHRGLKGRWLLVRELAGMNFDLTILLQNAFEAALITSLAGIPVRAGYNTDGRSILLTHRVKLDKTRKKIHQVHYYQGLLSDLGLEPGSDELFLQLSEKVKEWARGFIDGLGMGAAGGPVIGLNPGASYGPAKRWPVEKFAGLAADIAGDLEGQILVFGTEADREAAKIIREAAPDRVADLTGRTSLEEAMALIERCQAFVTNDSGLMHVSAALKTPTAAIFGSTNHVTTGPFSENSIVVRKDISCSPCLKTHCNTDFKCMHEIGCDEVLTAVESLLEGGKTDGE